MDVADSVSGKSGVVAAGPGEPRSLIGKFCAALDAP